MPITNALLVRYDGGLTTCVDQPSIDLVGRREGFLQLGSVSDEADVQRICAALFDTEARATMAVTAAIEPGATGTDTPYVGFLVGDTVHSVDATLTPTTYRVVGVTVAEDPEGNPMFVPELNDLLVERSDGVQRWLKRMVSGGLGGSEAALPAKIKPPGLSKDGPLIELPPFSFSGLLEPGASGIYVPGTTVYVVQLDATLVASGSSDTVVALTVNGVTFATVTFHSGSTHEKADVGDVIPVGAAVRCVIVSAPADSADLVVTVRVKG